MLAVKKHTALPEINALNDTEAICCFLFGLRAPNTAITIPIEAGLAKPHTE